jgi:hypothetical protein
MMTDREWSFVPVIVPVRNEANFIGESLGAVLELCAELVGLLIRADT